MAVVRSLYARAGRARSALWACDDKRHGPGQNQNRATRFEASALGRVNIFRNLFRRPPQDPLTAGAGPCALGELISLACLDSSPMSLLPSIRIGHVGGAWR